MSDKPSTSLFLIDKNYDTSTGDYVLKFNSPQQLSNMEIALINSNVYKQWNNIDATLNNNTLILRVTVLVNNEISYVESTFTIPIGYYTVNTFYDACKKWMDEDPDNRKTITGEYSFTITTQVDGRISFTCNSSVYNSRYYYCLVLLQGDLNQFLGITSSISFGGVISVPVANNPSSRSVSGSNSPKLDPISTLIFTTNLNYNPIVNQPRGIISSNFLAGTDYGASSVFSNFKLLWLPILNATYDEIRISTYSQDGQKLKYIDNNSVFQIALRKIK